MCSRQGFWQSPLEGPRKTGGGQALRRGHAAPAAPPGLRPCKTTGGGQSFHLRHKVDRIG